MSYFETKMHQIRFRLGLRPRPRWGSLQRFNRPSSWIKGVLLLRGRQGKEGKEGMRGRGREGQGGGGRERERRGGERMGGEMREGRRRRGEKGGEEALLVMWPTKLSVLNLPLQIMKNCVTTVCQTTDHILRNSKL